MKVAFTCVFHCSLPFGYLEDRQTVCVAVAATIPLHCYTNRDLLVVCMKFCSVDVKIAQSSVYMHEVVCEYTGNESSRSVLGVLC